MVPRESFLVGTHPRQGLPWSAPRSSGVILVFGGGGQLGHELARLAARRNIVLAALSRRQADINDRTAIEATLVKHKPSLVVNAAAYTKVDHAETEIAAALQTNAHGPAVLASACAAANVPLLHISTDYVFDGTKHGAYLETDPINPINAYGRSKAMGEARCDSTNRATLFYARLGCMASLDKTSSRQ